MSRFLWIGLGGFIGALTRYTLAGWVQQTAQNPAFPYGTLVVNLLGCLVIGFLHQWAQLRDIFSPDVSLMVFTGFLGSFTTFSTFANEGFLLFSHEIGFTVASVYIGVHLAGGLAAVWLGRWLAILLWA